jgi:drug/metabolite transporter (DMT)-like permease
MTGSTHGRAIAALLVAAFLFGATFVVIKSAVEDIGPLSFVAWRFLLGTSVLALFAIPTGRLIWRQGTLAGIALFAGYAFQTAGLQHTTASNSALITGLYVVITPFLAAAFSKRAPSGWTVGAAAVSFVGLVLLTGTDGLRVDRGDLLTVACALAFALHIVLLARFARHHPVVPFTTVQLAVTAVLAFVLGFAVEGPGLPPSSVWGALLLTGLAISAGAFLLQIWAQTVVGPTTAAVIVATESVFGVGTAWIVLQERLGSTGFAGASLMVVSVVVVIVKQRDPTAVAAESVTPAH